MPVLAGQPRGGDWVLPVAVLLTPGVTVLLVVAGAQGHAAAQCLREQPPAGWAAALGTRLWVGRQDGEPPLPV